MSDSESSESRARWKQEAAFFDRRARAQADQLRPTAAITLARYRQRRRRYFSLELRYRLMGDLNEKVVLDVGCGVGVHSVIIAQLGARVTGVDVSAGAIQLAERRAAMNGVADRATFRCAPMERVDLDPASVDIVWIHAFLHHVIPDIRSVLSKVRDAIRPGGLVVIAEPVSLSPLLRRLRFAVARFSEHTPDERPLEQRELDLIREVFPEMHVRYFRGVSRLDRFVLPDHQYESASSWRRAAIVCLSICDYMLLSLPWFRRVASGVVISARL